MNLMSAFAHISAKDASDASLNYSPCDSSLIKIKFLHWFFLPVVSLFLSESSDRHYKQKLF